MPLTPIYSSPVSNVVESYWIRTGRLLSRLNVRSNYPEPTCQVSPDDVPLHHVTTTVFVVLHVLVQLKSCGGFGLMCKTPFHVRGLTSRILFMLNTIFFIYPGIHHI
ncbi:Bgt-20983 [Blumeria graminis f. sp. tritici]|uniref:Bgt-20983 n=2 Tax=Blumeria graminis f. sp. tritici TaxID=62690 RepID=A0A9X9MLK0_BLUGR|nr:Bgt-20983 [Blumeria graminis f. sp. tritici]